MRNTVFGFLFGGKNAKDPVVDQDNVDRFVRKAYDDGGIDVSFPRSPGFEGFNFDLAGNINDESALVTRYRAMALDPKVIIAVDEVINDSINIDVEEDIVKIVVNDTQTIITPKIRKLIETEFSNVLRLLDFSNQGYEIFKNFYVDGRLNFHIAIDEEKPTLGIKSVRYMDPRKVRLIREYETNFNHDGIPGKLKRQYYLYHEGAFIARDSVYNSTLNGPSKALMMTTESVVRVTSGLMNETSRIVLSHLHQAIRPFNQLKSLEDSVVIYRLVRSPERRVFNIELGNMPAQRAETYMQDMMRRHKDKMVYDSTNGEIRSDKNTLAMTYDYWFAKRDGKGTSIDTLPPGQNLGELDDVEYFKRELYKALKVPSGRMEDGGNMFSMGRPSEITREELKFAKFIRRLRTRFSILFDEILRRQLLLKNILTEDEWQQIKDEIRYDFVRDNYYEEMKQGEILKDKMATLRELDDLAVGKYYSKKWVRKNVLFQSDTDIEEEDKQIAEERKEDEANGFGEETEE